MSQTAPQYAALGFNHRDSAICRVCQAIPFDRLPAEEEAAYPHHASLDDLRTSANKCALCALLVQAIDEETRRSGAEKHRSGVLLGDFAASLQDQGFSNPVTGYVESVQRCQSITLDDNGTDLVVRDLARHQAATFTTVSLSKYGVTVAESAKPPPQPAQPVPSGLAANPPSRPWVYGNWWLLDQPDESTGPVRKDDYYRLQLIGIGVRLTEKPVPHTCKMYDRSVVHLRGSCLRVFTEPGDPSAQHVPGRIRELFSGSLKARDLIRFWTQNCDRGHNCQQKDAPLLPTRVLDLGSVLEFKTVRLWETGGAKGQYLALSHSWGGADILTTKRQTLQAHSAGIQIKRLPQTFLDAVQIALGLGLRYVWIDSLCIIQDDFSDWEREAPRMADVYHGAYLTVSASHALNALEGCFPRFRMFEYQPMDTLSTGFAEKCNHGDFVPVETSVSFRRPSKLFFHKNWMPPSEMANPTVYRVGNYGKKGDPIALETLSSRAWTLQERLLSPRVLHFGREQMYWECKHCFIAEDGARFDPKTFSLDRVLQAQRLQPDARNEAEFLSYKPEALLPSGEDGRRLCGLRRRCRLSVLRALS
ncbi:hypothetical protein FNYG_05706 [Fusarium nygamai]|uniref:Heterokaryon incompatibility domain-containing protein n=1 Tax=Gibberella nygamai TaxID=42673 RepID=A0A2K0WF34_GIBNY|nr:hypothetical protein FNYG_05706 [Fusarium nygamai]